MRLPNAVNGKTKYHDGSGRPFRCRLVRWEPEAAFTVDELLASFQLEAQQPQAAPDVLATPRLSPPKPISDGVWTPAPAENPVVSALKARGLYKRLISAGRHDVTCPWIGEHTDAVDGGSAYFEPDEERPFGGFKCQHSHGDKYRIHELLDFLEVDEDAARGRARIDVRAGEMSRVRRASERALADLGGYFQAGGAIVVVRTDPGSGEVATQLLGDGPLATALSDAADWYKYDGRAKKTVRMDPPVRNVQALLRAERFDFLPVLKGLARQPFFREAGVEVVNVRGYDPVSGRYGAFDPSAFPLPEPTREAAEAALVELDALLDEFRFANVEDRSATLCAMLTGAVRSGLPVAPAFNVTAASPGSGKSYLASLITLFAGPGGAQKLSYPTTAEEASKALLSAFITSPAAIIFDDMQTQWLAWGAMNRALTSETVTDRLLGTNRTATAGTRSLILGTGNNVGPVRDMARRLLTITLHHKTATPATVAYGGRPTETVAAARGKYVAAALTIVAAHRRAGAPRGDVPPIASYEQWSDMCRQPLIWLGRPDPASSLLHQLAHDPDQDALGQLLRAWHAQFGNKPVMVRTVVQEADGDLFDALLELPVVEREAVNRDKLGWYLKRSANRPVEGFELQRIAHSTRTMWRVVSIEEAALAA